jgi:hypothetical protein
MLEIYVVKGMKKSLSLDTLSVGGGGIAIIQCRHPIYIASKSRYM